MNCHADGSHDFEDRPDKNMLELTTLQNRNLTMYIWLDNKVVPWKTHLDFNYSIEDSVKKLPHQNWHFLGSIQATAILDLIGHKNTPQRLPEALELKVEPVKQNIKSFFSGLELMADKYVESETDKKAVKRVIKKCKEKV